MAGLGVANDPRLLLGRPRGSGGHRGLGAVVHLVRGHDRWLDGKGLGGPADDCECDCQQAECVECLAIAERDSLSATGVPVVPTTTGRREIAGADTLNQPEQK